MDQSQEGLQGRIRPGDWVEKEEEDGPRGHCTWGSVPRVGQIAKTRDGPPFTVRYALQNSPARARHVVYARDGAGI